MCGGDYGERNGLSTGGWLRLMTSQGVILSRSSGVAKDLSYSDSSQERSLGPLVKARAFGMTAADKNSIEPLPVRWNVAVLHSCDLINSCSPARFAWSTRCTAGTLPAP